MNGSTVPTSLQLFYLTFPTKRNSLNVMSTGGFLRWHSINAFITESPDRQKIRRDSIKISLSQQFKESFYSTPPPPPVKNSASQTNKNAVLSHLHKTVLHGDVTTTPAANFHTAKDSFSFFHFTRRLKSNILI